MQRAAIAAAERKMETTTTNVPFTPVDGLEPEAVPELVPEEVFPPSEEAPPSEEVPLAITVNAAVA